jgi:hypothetical protein
MHFVQLVLNESNQHICCLLAINIHWRLRRPVAELIRTQLYLDAPVPLGRIYMACMVKITAPVQSYSPQVLSANVLGHWVRVLKLIAIAC